MGGGNGEEEKGRRRRKRDVAIPIESPPDPKIRTLRTVGFVNEISFESGDCV